MNNFFSDLMGMEGRINRQRWWIGVIVLAVLSLIIVWVLGLLFGTSIMISPDIATDPAQLAAYSQKGGWIGLIAGIITAYPYISLSVKRRHDRNNNGFDAMALVVIGIIWNLLAALGVGITVGVIGGVISVVIGILAIWILVQCGFLKGTAGSNSYGPDPLGG